MKKNELLKSMVELLDREGRKKRRHQAELQELLSSQLAVRQELGNAQDEALTLNSLPAGDARYFNRSGPLEKLRDTLDAW